MTERGTRVQARVTFDQGLSQKPALITSSLSYNRAYAIGPGVRLGLGALHCLHFGTCHAEASLF